MNVDEDVKQFARVGWGGDANEAFRKLQDSENRTFPEGLCEREPLEAEHPGKVFRDLRKALGCSQAYAAQFFSCSQPVVSEFEREDLSERSKLYDEDVTEIAKNLITDQVSHPDEAPRFDYYLRELERALNGYPTCRQIERWFGKLNEEGLFIGDPVRCARVPGSEDSEQEGSPFLFFGWYSG